MARLFIGVPVPDEAKKRVVGLQDALSKAPMTAKAVEPENLHISLSFLGETPEEEIPKLSGMLDSVCSARTRFTVKVGGAKLIPNESYMRVIALDVSSSGDGLESLRKDIVAVVGGESHPAHLTLFRVRRVMDKRFVAEAARQAVANEYFEVASVCLIESRMSQRGPRYRVVHESALK